MPPRTRATATRESSGKEINISSDSEEDCCVASAKKRKTQHKETKKFPPPKMSDDENAMDIDEWSLPTPPTSVLTAPKSKVKNSHLKGRKRFMADLEDLRVASAEVAIEMHDLQVKSLRAGEEEGSIELKVLRGGRHFIALNLLIDDTAEYPRKHTFFSFVQDVEISPHVLEVVESMSSASPKPLMDTVKSLLASIAASLAQGKYVPQEDTYIGEDAHDDDSESDEVGAYEDDIEYNFDSVQTESQSWQFAVLKTHFISVIEAGFKPGLTRIADDEMVLSISSPVPSLTISPRALVAWDRRLLSSYHNLTLLISGLRGFYPVLSPDGSFTPGNANLKLKFHVGLSPKYKPSKEAVLEDVRDFGIIRVEDEDHAARPPEAELDGEQHAASQLKDPGRFEKFSLSSSLETLLSSQIVSLIQLRQRFKLGWAGAEILHAGSIQSQQKPEELIHLHEQEVRAADTEEAQLQHTYSLPPDPLSEHPAGELNLPLVAYCYLLRRLTLCSRYCLVCHTRIVSNFDALKPYVCDSKLCTYQYYALNFGPSVEYEICSNPQAVDLLVSLAYTSAQEHQLSEQLPIGLGLRVPSPKPLPPPPAPMSWIPARQPVPVIDEVAIVPKVGSDGLCDFDELPLTLMRAAITEMIASLPPIMDIKQHLERKSKVKVRPQLRMMDQKVLPAAWSILRWCVASSTAYLEEISDPDEMISNIEPNWRQFRFSVGAPDKEARYKAGLDAVQKVNVNARNYPAIYGFHGSSLKNWHSIIRQGLLVKQAVHGRAYGDGVYFAKEGSISMGHYAQPSLSRWSNSDTRPVACVALAEIVNSPNDFTSSHPYYVVNQVHWILCRYLLVKTDMIIATGSGAEPDNAKDSSEYVTLDPNNSLTMNSKEILIPEQSRKLQMLLEARKAEQPDDDGYDDEDERVFNGTIVPASQPGSQVEGRTSVSNQAQERRAAKDDWQHNEEWCDENTYQLMPPPTDSTPHAALALQKELRAILKEQGKSKEENSLRELGWYMPPELMGDNLFRWMLELHSFEPALPIAKDMIQHNVPSLLFEIRFPGSYPIQPPFFRIVKPRFLPFIQGGGGHVTGGGSICMDLLVSDGWLPSYSLSAVLLQIRLAISNLDPRPARLAPNWNTPYTAAEALEGFKRAARTHGWTVPAGLERLVR